jgi:hypothetical protein
LYQLNVKTSDDKELIAHANEREWSGDDSKQYKDGSEHEFSLDVDEAGLAKSSARGFHVQVCQTTHGGAGHDTWRWQGRVVLQFSDKSNLVAESGTVELVNNNACTSFNAP